MIYYDVTKTSHNPVATMVRQTIYHQSIGMYTPLTVLTIKIENKIGQAFISLLQSIIAFPLIIYHKFV